MLLVDAIDQMDEALGAIGAPARQRRGVLEWRLDVAVAVRCASVFTKPRGMRIAQTVYTSRRPMPNPALAFVSGDLTHRAWVRMCRALLSALHAQIGHAAALHEHFKAVALSADDPAVANAAAVLAQAAWQWQAAASSAADRGRLLVERENRIHLPVGYAVAAAGGVHQVAQAKNYHQAGV